MHIHILGICGTFMGSLAQLAVAMGHRVTGSDQNVYPPMSDQLAQAGIELTQGYDPGQLAPAPDLVVIGNALSRGNPVVEAVLDQGLTYTSGPAFLAEHILPGRWVLAVAGTHGKTTTASMLAWILESAGLSPGFLIGGVPGNFPVSARVGESPFFVVEADEYDTAFFDKRSKFVHYRPRTLILNNLEYDHADIFPDLAAIQKQFHHLIRTVPGSGQIILPGEQTALEQVLNMGCWTAREYFGKGSDNPWTLLSTDGSHWQLNVDGQPHEIQWPLTGLHNVANGCAALLAARHVGVPISEGARALSDFAGVRRRMELLADVDSIRVFDDFAHHPTAIATTLEGLRQQVGQGRIIAVIEPRSNTMRMGAHRQQLADAVAAASEVIWYQPPGLDWSLDDIIRQSSIPACTLRSIDAILGRLSKEKGPASIVIMSNGGFEGIHHRLCEQLQDASASA